MTHADLQTILTKHAAWLNDPETGERANLIDANLTGANLTGADLRRADLTGANLIDANLTGANLIDANLTGANLIDANLTGANLRRADLTGANLTGADLRRADLTGADLTGANLRRADLTTQNGLTVPWHTPDPELPARVAAAALQPGCLDMGAWHTCETTHCLAGWAVQLSGLLGKALEALTSPSVAGSILMPSASHLFFSDNETALAWCREQIKPS